MGDPKEFGVAVVSASKLSSRYSHADSTLDTHTLRHDSSCWSWSCVCVCGVWGGCVCVWGGGVCLHRGGLHERA